MKKITIELDDAFASAVAFTAIGAGGGYGTNIFTCSLNLQESGNHWKMVREGGVEKMKLVKVTEVDHDKK